MEFENTGQEEMDLGFVPVPKGTYVYQIQDGIELRVAEDSDSKGFSIPLKVDQVVDGDPDADGMGTRWYVNVIKKDGETNAFGERQVNTILTLTDLVDSFKKNFKSGVENDDEKFVNALKLKLPGKFLVMTHDLRKDNNDNYQMNFTKVRRVKKKTGGAGKTPTPDSKPDSEDEDWVD